MFYYRQMVRCAQFEKIRARDGVECSGRLFDSRIQSNAIDALVLSMRSKRHNVTTPPTTRHDLHVKHTLPQIPNENLNRSPLIAHVVCTKAYSWHAHAKVRSISHCHGNSRGDPRMFQHFR